MNFFSFLTSPGWQSGLLHWLFVGPLGLILADVVTGVSSALKNGTFTLKNLADFLAKDILKYLGGGLTVGSLSTGLHWSLDANLVATGATMLGISLSVIASLVQNIAEMLPKSSPLEAAFSGVEGVLQQATIDQQNQALAQQQQGQAQQGQMRGQSYVQPAVPQWGVPPVGQQLPQQFVAPASPPLSSPPSPAPWSQIPGPHA